MSKGEKNSKYEQQQQQQQQQQNTNTKLFVQARRTWFSGKCQQTARARVACPS